MNTHSSPASWHPDPTGRHQHRWWDGTKWTDQVADGGVSSVDPISSTIPPPATAAPSPGTPVQMASPAPVLEKHPQTTLTFVLGLLGLLLCGVLGPIAWIIGGKARKEVTANPGRYANDGLLTAGYVMGIIGSVFLALSLAWILFVVLAVAGSG